MDSITSLRTIDIAVTTRYTLAVVPRSTRTKDSSCVVPFFEKERSIHFERKILSVSLHSLKERGLT
jgi:hypothetical protein